MFNLFKCVVVSIFLLITGGYVFAFDASRYAASSVLSSGNWAKIEVSTTGMHFISDEILKSLGFNDSDKVNVYGYGGVVIPENLNSPDDLPMIPSLRVKGGIVFFGQAAVGWERNYRKETEYSHLSHPYSDKSYYFITDCNEVRRLPESIPFTEPHGELVTEFTERMVHEQDISMPMMSGRLMLGEDFRVSTLQSFHFSLPGNRGDAKITVAFGCKTSSGISSLVFSANGQQLGATTADQMIASDSKLIVTTKTVKTISNPGEDLNLSIKFNGSGSVSTAALDYIEIEYPRKLDASEGELYFYVNTESGSAIRVEGVNQSTLVWDITDNINPKQLEIRVDGSMLTFMSEAGYHEYIAFDPESVDRNVIGYMKVENQDIHSMATPDMLVISPPEYIYAAQRFASLHQQFDGLKVLTLTPEMIYNEFSCGKPDVSAFRKLLKMWYDKAAGVEGEYPAYCLIMSRPTYDNKIITTQVRNAGYPRIPIWQSPNGETESSSYSTDDYIGMLEDVDDNFNIGSSAINVAVGRMPVKSLNEANLMIDKLESYLLNPDLGAWRNNILVIADDQDKGVHIEQAEKVIGKMKSYGKGEDVLYEKLYLDSYTLEYTGVGVSYPKAHEKLMNKWDEGVCLINYIGHANAKSWGHESLLSWSDINSMTNTRLPFIYAATCDFMRWDSDDISGAESLWLQPSSGIIGTICPSREVLISANGDLNYSISKYMFQTDENGQNLSVGEIMKRGKNDSNTGANKLRYGLLGDPSLKLPFPSLTVKIDEINGINIQDSKEFPEIKARSKVEINGEVTRDNEVISDFNGIVEISLYDAEKIITTNGNGAEGVESLYNDRKTRLYYGRFKVTGGRWSASFTMPIEIENNYSPALFSFYAYEEDGREANGMFDKFYVYGFEEDVPEDFDGPQIIDFYLNTPNFVNGSEVSPNPVLYARFYDESGINVSESGIGHNMILELDGKHLFDDISRYYIADEENPDFGNLIYPLPDIGYGTHTLKFMVWDNANNSTTVSLDFVISVLWKPSIEVLTTDVNPASTDVNFIIETDGNASIIDCVVEVYDLSGRNVWKESTPLFNGSELKTTLNWNLCDFGGARIQPGLYLYRATVKTDSGARVTKSNKLIVR